jgi:ferredoxin
MKKVTIEPGCIACGLCQSIAPDVFQVNDIAHIKEDADLENNAELIREAAISCPVQVIKVEE